MEKQKGSESGTIKEILTGKEWQALLVNQYGRIVRVPHLQRYVIMTAIVTILALAAAACLTFLLVREKNKNWALQESIATTDERISSLIDEKDLLLARLVIMRNILAEEKPDAAARIFADASQPKPQPTQEDAADIEQEAELNSLSDDMADDDRPTAAVVDVRQLSVTREAADSRLSIRFQIHKINTVQESVSGRIFVVLEDDSGRESERLVVPATQLKDGVPDRIDRGDYFSIARFKTVNLNARAAHPEKITRAVVFVFSLTGEIIYKNQFDIEVTIAPAAG